MVAEGAGEGTVPALSADDLRDIYRVSLLSRLVEERLWALNKQGKVHFVITPAGHEIAQAASIKAMRPGTDMFVPYYRSITAVLALGMTPRDIFLHGLGRAADPSSAGRQMTGHYSSRRLRIVSGSSSVGSHIPHGAGIAYASKVRRDGAVTIVYFGEGATSTGDFHVTMNFAGIHRLPVIFFCENNGWAISTPQALQVAGPGVAARAAAYGFAGVQVDGTDPDAVYRAVAEARRRAAAGEGPTLIEAKVLRLTSHSGDDDHRRYRSAEELAEEARRDPLLLLGRRLAEEGILSEEEQARLRAELQREVDQATREAEASPPPAVETATRNVYAEA